MTGNRPRWLLPLFGLVVGGYVFYLMLDRFYYQPLETESRLTTSLEKRISETRLKLKRLNTKLPRRAQLESRSLPADVEMASSTYQTWLINLVSSLGLINPTVDSTSPILEAGISRLQFKLRGKASIKQLTTLLFEFYRSGNLHKIRQLSLTPTGSIDQLDIQLSIEALSLDRSDNELELTALASNRLSFDKLADYMTITKRNVFSAGSASAGIRAARLTAVTSDGQGIAEAWISLGVADKTLFMKAGDTVQIDSVEVVIKEIQDDSIQLEMDGQIGTVQVGKSLGDIELTR